MSNLNGLQISDAENELRFDGDKAVFKRTQDLGTRFMSNLADQRFESTQSRMGEYHHVASIPTAVVENWMAEGFNIFDKNISIKDIILRLQRLDMDGLMATSKNVV